MEFSSTMLYSSSSGCQSWLRGTTGLLYCGYGLGYSDWSKPASAAAYCCYSMICCCKRYSFILARRFLFAYCLARAFSVETGSGCMSTHSQRRLHNRSLHTWIFSSLTDWNNKGSKRIAAHNSSVVHNVLWCYFPAGTKTQMWADFLWKASQSGLLCES